MSAASNLHIVPAVKFDLAAENRKRDEIRERAAKNWAALDALRPAKACALIVAELEEDTSDMMSDYHGSRTTRRVAIGWRTGKREDFRQLRRAAAKYAPTAHLGPDCGDFWIVALCGEYRTYMPLYDLHGKRFATRKEAEDAIAASRECMNHELGRVEYAIHGSEKNLEHRDNYSMGHGNWVGLSQYSGWQVRSFDLDYSGYRSDPLILWLPGLEVR